MNFLKRIVTLAVSFIALNLLWLLGSILLATVSLPSPLVVYANLPKVLSKGIYAHILASGYRLFAGLLISVLIALVVGVAMGSIHAINKALSPVIYLTYPIPKMALLPVIMLLFGLGDNSKIILIVLINVFQMTVSVRDATMSIPVSYYNVLNSLGASYLQRLWTVTLPAIVPQTLTALKLSVGTALSVLFFAENFGTRKGLGYFIQDCWMRLDYVSMYGAIILLGFIGLLLFVLIDFVIFLYTDK